MASTNIQLGVKWPCYGDFKCPTCKRSWDSCLAWRDFGQECRTCFVNVRAHHIEEAYRYVCKDCQLVWKWKWSEEGRECPKCGEIKKTSRNHAVVTRYIKANLQEKTVDRKLHDTKLCEKYTILGRDCRSSMNMAVTEVMEIAANRFKPPTPSNSRKNEAEKSNAGISASARPRPTRVRNIENNFRKVTPGISYSAVVVAGNNPTMSSTPPSLVKNSQKISNGTCTVKQVQVIKPVPDESDDDVYENRTWAAAYKRMQEEQFLEKVPPQISTRNGNTGNAYYHVSIPVNRKACQQQPTWGCNIL